MREFTPHAGIDHKGRFEADNFTSLPRMRDRPNTPEFRHLQRKFTPHGDRPHFLLFAFDGMSVYPHAWIDPRPYR